LAKELHATQKDYGTPALARGLGETMKGFQMKKSQIEEAIKIKKEIIKMKKEIIKSILTFPARVSDELLKQKILLKKSQNIIEKN
jgi:hypothetical protein